MVRHERPDDEKRPLITYVCNSNQVHMVETCIDLLEDFPMLKVWEVQYPSAGEYTCFYISFRHQETPWIINFTMYPNYCNVEFRYSQFLPYKVLDDFRWITSNWAYTKFRTNNRKRIEEILNIYITNIREDFDKGKLRQGGKSFAEKLITDILKATFPNWVLKRNVRPDWLKNDKGNLVELDILVPEMRFAIEIQGPQHFKPIWDEDQFNNLKKNDLHTKETCREKDIKLIWMNVEGINKDLLRIPHEKRVEIVGNLVNNFLDSNHSFLYWKSTKEEHFG